MNKVPLIKKEMSETRKDFDKIFKAIDEYNKQSTLDWITRKIKKPDMELYHYLRGRIEVYDDVVSAIKIIDDIIENREDRLKGLREFRKSRTTKDFEPKKNNGRIDQLVEDLRFFKKIKKLFGDQHE